MLWATACHLRILLSCIRSEVIFCVFLTRQAATLQVALPAFLAI